MSIKGKKFTDDGWAIWIDGDDTSTIYFHDWMSPKGKSYIDVSVKIVGIKATSKLCLYVPFEISADEIEDISLAFKNEEIARATFSSGCSSKKGITKRLYARWATGETIRRL